MNEIKIFENKEIRSIWDKQNEQWLFSVVDIVGALTESSNPRDYWYRVKKRMSKDEQSELSTNCRQLTFHHGLLTMASTWSGDHV